MSSITTPQLKQLRFMAIIKINFFNIFHNTGNIQNAANNKGVSQTTAMNPIEFELLKQENKYLKEKIQLLELLLKSYQI